MSFREDGAAALDWAARYLERVDELPVLAQVEPGELSAKLPALAARDGRAVRERAPRPRRADRPGADELAAPALLRLLRRHRLGAGDPRRADRGDAEPGRDPLARLAGVDRARAAHGRLGAAAARPAGRLARAHRGHRLDLDARRADRGAPRHRPERRRVLGARAFVRREGGADARDGAAQGAGRTRSCACGADLVDTRATWRRSSRRSGTTSFASVDPGAGARRGRARGGRLAPRRRRVRRLGLGLRGGALVAGRGRARRLGRRQSAQVAARADGLLAALDVAAGGVPRGVLARRPSTCARRRTRSRSRTTARRSAAASAR